MKNINIIVVDDHPSVSYGIKWVLNQQSEMNVVAAFSTATDLLSSKKDYQADIIILDISLPDASGLTIIEKIKSKFKNVKIIILSMFCRSDYIFQAIEKGVSGYVTKETPPENLALGIKQVISGEYYFDKPAMELIIKRILEKKIKVFNYSDENYNRLTSREQEIFRMLAEAFTPNEIAERLFISKRTVENYRTNILKKLELQNAVELVYYAQRKELI